MIGGIKKENMSDVNFMKEIDAEYCMKTGLSKRRFYSIFYSKIVESPIMIIGYNPGGNPENWDESQLASTSFYENGEHEYVDCHYPLAVGTRDFIKRAMKLESFEPIRKIPKINLIFRRSSSQDTLKMSPKALLNEAQEFVERIIIKVNPKVIIVEGKTTLDKLNSNYCSNVKESFDGASVYTPNGKYKALIYRADKSFMNCLNREVTLIGVGHPSKYANRQEWDEVIANSKKILNSNG